MKLRLFVLSSLCIMMCCKKENNTLPLINQQILFQVEYINGAWSFQHFGWLMDSSGNVRNYKLPEKWNFSDSAGYMSSADMSENFHQLDTVICKINKDTLQKYFYKLTNASTGKLTKPETQMYDAGSTLFSGYIYDLKSEKYKQILIKQIGDVYIENQSLEAKQIYNWMIRIGNRNTN